MPGFEKYSLKDEAGIRTALIDWAPFKMLKLGILIFVGIILLSVIILSGATGTTLAKKLPFLILFTVFVGGNALYYLLGSYPKRTVIRRMKETIELKRVGAFFATQNFTIRIDHDPLLLTKHPVILPGGTIVPKSNVIIYLRYNEGTVKEISLFPIGCVLKRDEAAKIAEFLGLQLKEG